MTSTTKNEWLEAEVSDDENDQEGYDSEAADEKPSFRAPKRRRLSQERNDDDEDEADDVSDDDDEEDDTRFQLRDEDDEDDEDKATDEIEAESFRRQIPKSILKAQKKTRKSGVVYLSRIPPFMKPAVVKSHMEPFGAVGRIFLTPEDPTAYSKRVRTGGNKKRSYTDGWVEFLSKKNAKVCAATLNTEIVGGKKGSWYHDDVWNVKYLTGFKWDNLMEQIRNENAERASRLRAEISQTTKENKRYIENVERAKMLEGIQKKRADRVETDQSSEPHINSVDEAEHMSVQQKRNRDQTFKQSEVRRKASSKAGQVDESVQRVLSRIF